MIDICSCKWLITNIYSIIWENKNKTQNMMKGVYISTIAVALKLILANSGTQNRRGLFYFFKNSYFFKIHTCFFMLHQIFMVHQNFFFFFSVIEIILAYKFVMTNKRFVSILLSVWFYLFTEKLVFFFFKFYIITFLVTPLVYPFCASQYKI